MGASASATGPDFSAGIDLTDCPAEGTIAGRVGDTPVLLSRIGGEFFAVSGACTHYGAALAEGHIGKSEVRCPLHHACFDLKTGAVLRAPALEPLDSWRVDVEGGRLFVRGKLVPAAPQTRLSEDVRRIVIVGGGAAGLACAVELRRLGYDGELAMLSEDEDPPYDRPNLSKDYLAGSAQEEWMPLRSEDWYRDNRVDLRIGTKVTGIELDHRQVTCESGEKIGFDRLLIATGSRARSLEQQGFSGPNVYTLRSFSDARAIIGSATPGSRAVILGSSFIGLEAAAALRQRGVEVTVVSPEDVPFERLFGPELGRLLLDLHEQHGVKFRLSNAGARFDEGEVVLAKGDRVPADFVLVGVGATPRTDLAEVAGLTVDNGVWVNEQLETSCPGVFAAGDIAAYPDPISKERVRIEHWTVAERQGQVAAANMLGARQSFRSAPFFWTEQHGLAVRYVGHAGSWDDVQVEGPTDRREMVVRYFQQGKHLASATVNRDQANLEDELALETEAARA